MTKPVITQNDSFTQRVMSDLDPELLALIQSKFNTFLKWDLVKFFGENPGTLDGAAQIAVYIGRDAGSTEAELDELVEKGILQRDERKTPRVYSLAGDEKTRALLRKFLRACDDRNFRVKAVYHLVRGLQRQ